MILKPEIEAEIYLLPKGDSPREGPLQEDVVGFFGCPMILPSGNWDCRMVFPNSQGIIALGETAKALIQFLSPKDVLKNLNVGDTFELWESGCIATGRVTKILKGPTSG
jgi:hypothetical protein